MKFVQSNVFSQPISSSNNRACILVQKRLAANERLAHTPELYLLALAQFAITADTEVVSIPNSLLSSFVLTMW